MAKEKLSMSEFNRIVNVINKNAIDFSEGMYYGYDPKSDQFEFMNRQKLKTIRPDLTDEILNNIPDDIPF